MSNGRGWRRSWVAGLACLVVGCGAASPTNTDVGARGGDRTSVPPAPTHAMTSMHHPRHPGPPSGTSTTNRVHPKPVRHSQAPRHDASRPRRHARHRRKPVAAVQHDGVPRIDVPDRRLTPGAVLTASAATVCVVGYASSVRDVPSALSEEAYRRYGVVHVPYAHEVDHLVSLELGGSNAITNLWPEPYAGRWGARTKDALENRLHSLVCAGELKLRMAQHQEARDWVGAYRRYVGSAPSGPSTRGGSPVSTRPTGHGCEPGYSPCLPRATDLNCDDIAAAKKPVHVTGDDPYGLDADGDGSACEP
jgi:hypothetical protein